MEYSASYDLSDFVPTVASRKFYHQAHRWMVVHECRRFTWETFQKSSQVTDRGNYCAIDRTTAFKAKK
jgi:hypothetical protein